MLYGPSVVIAPPAKGDPGNAPASYAIQISAAVILPSRVAPIRALILVPEVGPLARNTSARVITILTGRPHFFESKAAADLGRDNPDAPFVHREQRGGQPSNTEVGVC